MALIKCKECGNEVSTGAKTCPKCGVSVKGKGIGLFGGIGLFLLVSMAAAVILPKTESRPPSSSSNFSPPSVQKTPKEEAIAALELKKFNWHKGGFGSIMVADITIHNGGKRNIKDVELKCTHYSNSGTRIDSNSRVIYEIVEAGKSRSMKDFSLGFIHGQAKSTDCEITDVVVM